MLESLFNKYFRNKETSAMVSCSVFCEIHKNIFQRLPLHRGACFIARRLLYHEKIFEWLVVKEFLSNSKRIFALTLQWSRIFCITCFFYYTYFFSQATRVRPQPSKLLIFSRFSELKVA